MGVTAFASDDDATNNQVTYSLDYTANGRFTINPITGVVTVANSAMLDREIAASYDLIVRATSADGSFSTRLFTVNVIEVNDNPNVDAGCEDAVTGEKLYVAVMEWFRRRLDARGREGTPLG